MSDLLHFLKNCLIVGYGSIGARHASILQKMGKNIAVVTQREQIPFPRHSSLEEALVDFQAELVIVSNKTHEHPATCRHLAELGYTGVALVEKPLAFQASDVSFTPPYAAYVAYNMRFHPVVRRVREKLEGKRVFSAQFSVGQYLPDWRPETDYRQCYSAHKEQGGGVLRDLSHELDLALWLFGDWRTVAARVGRWGDLEMSAEDTVDCLLVCEKCPAVNIHLDCQSRISHRHILIQAEGISIWADCLSGLIRCNDQTEQCETARNISFTGQLDAVLSGRFSDLCSWEQGTRVMRLIEAVERTANNACWDRKQ